MNQKNEGFKELRIEPVQSEKVKEHYKKKSTHSKSPKKKHSHKAAKENFIKNKTIFLDEENNSKKNVDDKNTNTKNNEIKNENFTQEINLFDNDKGKSSMVQNNQTQPPQNIVNVNENSENLPKKKDPSDILSIKVKNEKKKVEKKEKIGKKKEEDDKRKAEKRDKKKETDEKKAAEKKAKIEMKKETDEKKKMEKTEKAKLKVKPSEKPKKEKQEKKEKFNKDEGKQPKKKNSTQLVIKKKKMIINNEEYDAIDVVNIQKSQKHFTYVKGCYTIWSLPILILTLIDCHQYYEDAPEFTEYSKLKVDAFLAMIGLGALFIIDLILTCYFKGKKSKSFIFFIFGLNYIISLSAIIAYSTFFIWKLWDSKANSYCKIYIEMIIIFIIMATTSIRFFKLQFFATMMILYYILSLLIYFDYYHHFSKDDVFTLIKLGEIFCFIIITIILHKYDPFQVCKPIYEEEIVQSSKPISSILVKDKKNNEDLTNMTVIDIEKNIKNNKLPSLEVFDRSLDKKTNETLKKNMPSSHSFNEFPEQNESKKWLKIFNNFKKGVLILDKSFQIIFSNRKINKYIGLEESEKNSVFFQSSFENILPVINISQIEIPQILEGFIQNLDNDILLKKYINKIIDNIQIKDFFSDLKYVINEGLNVKNSAMCQSLKQQTISLKYKLNENIIELSFYSIDLKLDEKDYLILFFTDSSDDSKTIYNNNLSKSHQELKNNIFLSIGNELRQPINIVVEMLERIKENLNKNLNVGEFIDMAYQNSYLIFTYLSGILDLTAFNIDKFKTIYMEYDLKILIEHILSILKSQGLKKGVEITYTLHKNLPKIIFTDPLRLMQIILNLLKNSLKITDKGYVKLTITPDNSESDVLFQFEVSDSSSFILSPNRIGLLNNNDFDLWNLEMILTKKLIKKLGPPHKNSLLITSEKNQGNHYKFFLSNKQCATTDYFENLEDGLLESNYIEKKNKNIEIYKENLVDKEMSKNSSISISYINKDPYYNFTLFKIAMNNHYCYCPKVLIIFQDLMSIFQLQDILLNLGYISDFSADFVKGLLKIKERIKYPNCGKYCSKYEFILLDGNLEKANLGKINEEKAVILAFYDDSKNKENIKMFGNHEILNKNFNQEEISMYITKYQEISKK